LILTCYESDIDENCFSREVVYFTNENDSRKKRKKGDNYWELLKLCSLKEANFVALDYKLAYKEKANTNYCKIIVKKYIFLNFNVLHFNILLIRARLSD
jgi:hypothetical protein